MEQENNAQGGTARENTKKIPLPGSGSSASFSRVIIFMAFIVVGLVAWAVGAVSEKRTAKLYSMQRDTVRVPEFVYLPCPSGADSLAGASVPEKDAEAFVEDVYVSGYSDAVKDVIEMIRIADPAERERRLGRLESEVLDKARSKNFWKSIRGK